MPADGTLKLVLETTNAGRMSREAYIEKLEPDSK
jgi:hypothetical protein